MLEGRRSPLPSCERISRCSTGNVERVGRITRSLLSAARQSPMERRPVDLNTVVEESLVLVGKQMSKDRIQIVTALAPSLPKIRGTAHAAAGPDEPPRERAGRHAGWRHGPDRDVAVHRSGGRRTPRLVVADTGPGIPADVLPRISEPFYTTKIAGTGLGLPLSYNIVREHGGRVEVDSAAGRGTTFIITLPVDKPDP